MVTNVVKVRGAARRMMTVLPASIVAIATVLMMSQIMLSIVVPRKVTDFLFPAREALVYFELLNQKKNKFCKIFQFLERCMCAQILPALTFASYFCALGNGRQ